MIWGRSKYLLFATSFLVLGDTSLFFHFSLVCCSTVGILVWGYISLTQNFFSPLSKYFLVYGWFVFAVNILITLITSKSRNFLFYLLHLTDCS